MATNSVPLTPGMATFPDNTTNNIAPALQRVKSSAASSSTTGAPFFLQLAFDATVDEMCYFGFRMPDDYASNPVLKIQYKMLSATSGTVCWEGRIAAVTPGDSTDVDAKALASTNFVSVTVPGTAGFMAEASITLTNADSLAAGDYVIVTVRRDADGTNGSDTATADAEFLAASLVYTTV